MASKKKKNSKKRSKKIKRSPLLKYHFTSEERQKIRDVFVLGLRQELESSLLDFRCVDFLGENEEKKICAEIDRVMKKLIMDDFGEEEYKFILNNPPQKDPTGRYILPITSDTFREALQYYGTYWKNISFDLCELKHRGNWRDLTLQEIKNEYKWEYLEHWKYTNWFPTESSFIKAVQEAQVRSILYISNIKIQNFSDKKTLEELKRLVQTYKYPRDVDSIVKALKERIPLPYPIILHTKRGNYIVLSGNTRLNTAKILGITELVKIVEVP